MPGDTRPHRQTRPLSADERRLIHALLLRVPDYQAPEWLGTAMAVPLTNKRIGSLRLFAKARADDSRLFGRSLAELTFHDRDGGLVSVALYLDQSDQPFELDVWKVDFSVVLEVPMNL